MAQSYAITKLDDFLMPDYQTFREFDETMHETEMPGKE